MQALALAIGKSGIEFFAQQIMPHGLVQTLSRALPQDHVFSVPPIKEKGHKWSRDYTKIRIALSKGSLSGFQPAYRSVTQLPVPIPIMDGFQFVFHDAQVSIQQGYVSVLANIHYKSTTRAAHG